MFGLGSIKGKNYGTLLDDTEKKNAGAKAMKIAKANAAKASKAKAAKMAKDANALKAKKAAEDALMAEVYASQAKKGKK